MPPRRQRHPPVFSPFRSGRVTRRRNDTLARHRFNPLSPRALTFVLSTAVPITGACGESGLRMAEVPQRVQGRRGEAG